MDEQTIVERLKRGDDEAFREMMGALGPDLLQHASILAGFDSAQAEELASDTFSEAFLSVKRFKGEASLLTWLKKIMRNLHFERCRRVRRDTVIAENVRMALPDLPDWKEDDQPEIVRALPSLLHRLPEEQRQVVFLRYSGGMKLQKIAETLGVPEGTVKSRLFNVLASLKKSVESLNLSGNSVTE
jgi:RNA polymerase sigma-70 factor (ECF subfamily)